MGKLLRFLVLACVVQGVWAQAITGKGFLPDENGINLDGSYPRGTSEGAPNVDDQLRNGLLIVVTEDGSTFFAQSSEKAIFNNAKAVFKRIDYAGARKQFAEFLLRYPHGGYAPAARFWMGAADFLQGDYKAALLTLRPLQIDAPRYRNTPEAMLLIANCYIELKDPQAGRKTLEELVEQYERTEAASAARDRLAKLR
jgi:tol-pal system protein YbgF